MKHALFLAAALAALPVQADWVFRQGDDVIRLTDAPCINDAAIATIPDAIRPLFKQATAIVNGRTYAPCWAPYRAQTLVFYFEDGDQGMIDATALKVDPGT